jgi:hypothetical protein
MNGRNRAALQRGGMNLLQRTPTGREHAHTGPHASECVRKLHHAVLQKRGVE